MDLQVLILYLCADASDPASDILANIWCIFLQTSPNESVALRMVYDESSTGILTLESKDDVYPDEVLRVVQFRTLGQPTVRQMIRVLLERGRERYRLTQEGRGQRHWYARILADWEEEELLTESCAAVANENLQSCWYEGGSHLFLMIAGVFY
jgi:hypothetical protein